MQICSFVNKGENSNLSLDQEGESIFIANITSGQCGQIIREHQSGSRQHTLTHYWAVLLPLWNSHCYIIISFQSFTGITVTLWYQQEQLSICIVLHHFFLSELVFFFF